MPLSPRTNADLDTWLVDDDTPREKCGVFGIFGDPQASLLTAFGLRALQHRGEEACGIASFDKENNSFHNERRMGRVADAFGETDFDAELPGHASIGHNRYSTTGGNHLRNVQPIFADLKRSGFAIAHNGNLTNSRKLHRELVGDGAIFQSTMDTEVVIHLVARSKKTTFTDKVIDALQQIQGGFAFVGLTNKKLIGARDPVGLRPLVLGRLPDSGAWVLASETVGLSAVGAEYVRDIEPGEMVIISDEDWNEPRSITSIFPKQKPRPCAFEYIYFARPDSVVNGRGVYDVRHSMGQILAAETHVDADVVVPVPDSGLPAAIGYAKACGLPFDLGIIRSHYAGRTFIQPDQAKRQAEIRKKHSPNHTVLKGKRVILVDDSIVRGNTSKRIVEMVREAGAAEVHLRSASPKLKYPDYYGIDLAEESEFLASQLDDDGMRERLAVDSLGFLSVDGFYKACGFENGRDNDAPQLADHVFTGDYPTPLEDRDGGGSNVAYQMSLLDAASEKGGKK